MSDGLESIDTLEGFDFESDSDSDSESAERRGRWAPPARATGRGLYTPRPSTNPVTQVQMQAALSRVGDQMRRTSGAVNTVNSRVNAVNSNERRDNEERKKDLRSINEKIQLIALLPLLLKPSTRTVTGLVANTNLVANDKLLVDSGDTLTALLPLLLIGGFGSGALGSSGDSQGGMDSTTLLVLALALSGGLGGSRP